MAISAKRAWTRSPSSFSIVWRRPSSARSRRINESTASGCRPVATNKFKRSIADFVSFRNVERTRLSPAAKLDDQFHETAQLEFQPLAREIGIFRVPTMIRILEAPD